MRSERSARLTYEESCRLLQRLGRLAEGAIPPQPDRRPQSDDELSHGLWFFRTWVGSGSPYGLQASSPEDEEGGLGERDLENLTIPRTFFGRSEISYISFKNTDLSESTLCWNDFIDVDFTDADLSGSDLRASIFNRTSFVRANLQNADLRRSTFKECDFTGADLRGAKLTHEQGKALPLSEEQKRAIDWQNSAGDEPEGG
jgi:hypothetical protein